VQPRSPREYGCDCDRVISLNSWVQTAAVQQLHVAGFLRGEEEKLLPIGYSIIQQQLVPLLHRSLLPRKCKEGRMKLFQRTENSENFLPPRVGRTLFGEKHTHTHIVTRGTKLVYRSPFACCSFLRSTETTTTAYIIDRKHTTNTRVLDTRCDVECEHEENILRYRER